MVYVYSPQYEVDIGPHVFPTEKYRLIFETLKAEGWIQENNLVAPAMPGAQEISSLFTPAYWEDLSTARLTMRTARSELPVNRRIIDAQLLAAAGSALAAETALETGAAYHIGGGFHHAFPDHAEGFCYVNDIAWAVLHLLSRSLPRIAVIDLDLHQGNGTAFYFQKNRRVFTFSMHQEHLYPVKQKSTLDIGLENETGDDEYLSRLETALDGIFRNFDPVFIIYQGGADPYQFDQLGHLRLTAEGLARRDEAVIQRCRQSGRPMITVLGGGYAEQLSDTVEIHCTTARIMEKHFPSRTPR